MTDDGGVVDGDAAVAGEDLSVLGDDHGVDFDQAGAVILEGFVEADDQPGHLDDVRAGHLDLVGEVEGVVDLESADDIDVHQGDLVGGNRLDVHAALGGEHDHGTAGIRLGVDDDPGIVFLVDIQLFLDKDLFHQKSP